MILTQVAGKLRPKTPPRSPDGGRAVRYNFSDDRASSSRDRDDCPIHRGNYPSDRDNYPVDRDNYPVHRDSYPVDRDSYPSDRGNRLVNRDSYPGFRVISMCLQGRLVKREIEYAKLAQWHSVARRLLLCIFK